MEISFNVTGAIENITEESKKALKDLIAFNDAILLLRGNNETLTIKITDIIDIGVLEEKVEMTRALQIIK